MTRLFLALFIVFGTGCANHCKQIAQFRANLAARQPTSEPHVTIGVPLAMLNRLAAERVGRLEAVKLAPPLASLIVPELGGIEVVARTLTIVPAPDGQLGIDLAIALQNDDRDKGLSDELLVLHATANLDAAVVDGTLRLSLRPADVERFAPTLGDDAKDELARALGKLTGTKGSDLAKDASLLVEYLTEQGFDLVRDNLLRDLGAVASLQISLGPFPVKDIAVSSRTGAVPYLAIRVISELPIEAGISGPTPPQADAVRVAVSGDAVAAIGNWSMATGRLPKRYNDNMAPDPTGALEPQFDWEAGAVRPMLIHVFAQQPECFRMRIVARPEVAVESGKLVAGFDEGEVVETDGPLHIRLGVQWKVLGEDPLTAAQALAKPQIDVYGQPLELRPKDARRDDDTFVFDFTPSWTSPAPD